MRPLTLTWKEVWARRLARHGLADREPAAAAVGIAGRVCGIHAQVMTAAELSLGLRAGVTRSTVRRLLWDERRLVKTYGIRGTIHLFPSEELPLWTAALAARVDPREQKRLAELGLDRRHVDSIVHAMGEALDGRGLTLRDLGEAIADRLGSWVAQPTMTAFGGAPWPKWRVALGFAAGAGVLCYGPNHGSQVTFVRPDQWLGPWRHIDSQAALAEVFRRYLRAYGPATHRDFAQWFALPLRAARELAARLADELVEVDVEGYVCLQLRDEEDTSPRRIARTVRLLPHFDCYLRGCHPRSQLVPEHADRAAGGTGTVPVLLVDGTVAGIWDRRSRGGETELRVEAFRELDRRQRDELDTEAATVGEVLETKATLMLGPVTARPHL